jgi:hypothetical protein
VPEPRHARKVVQDLGRDDFIRVPSPAARTTTASRESVIGSFPRGSGGAHLGTGFQDAGIAGAVSGTSACGRRMALGTRAYPFEGEEDADVVNAGRATVTLRRGSSIFDSAMSFGMIRGGKIDTAILGAMLVSDRGDIANGMINRQDDQGHGRGNGSGRGEL